MISKRVIFVVVVVIAGIVGLTSMYFLNNKQKPTESVEPEQVVANLSNMDPGDFNSDLKSEYTKAYNLAVAANPQNALSAVVIDLGKDLMPEQTTIRYVFSSETDPGNNWTITFNHNGKSGLLRAIIPKDDYLGNPTPFDLKLWKVNHVSALQIAEKNGGLSWRENNTLQLVQLTLRNIGAENTLAWRVQYIGENSDFSINIEALTGKIFRE
ncbi:MAG TPA: hypothetical protein PK263_02105 [bacterium]|nr:hypothetical protein [bacterium]